MSPAPLITNFLISNTLTDPVPLSLSAANYAQWAHGWLQSRRLR
jgi:hypothetical protein